MAAERTRSAATVATGTTVAGMPPADPQVLDAARAALSTCECPAPEVLGAVEDGLVAVPAPLDDVPTPSSAPCDGSPLRHRAS
ncbi:MAG: hypothetical protein KJ792_00205 [Actinobacteria bacterium]|nr:hypothetical protein [Actinomycetota bacterium]MCG2801245.1 hypothetical protein [Cellulomonas sp.]